MNLIRSFFKVFFLSPLYYVRRYTMTVRRIWASMTLPCNLDTATESIIGVKCTIVKGTTKNSSSFTKTVLQ